MVLRSRWRDQKKNRVKRTKEVARVAGTSIDQSRGLQMLRRERRGDLRGAFQPFGVIPLSVKLKGSKQIAAVTITPPTQSTRLSPAEPCCRGLSSGTTNQASTKTTADTPASAKKKYDHALAFSVERPPQMRLPRKAPAGVPRPNMAKTMLRAGSWRTVVPTIPNPEGMAVARPRPEKARRQQMAMRCCLINHQCLRHPCSADAARSGLTLIPPVIAVKIK